MRSVAIIMPVYNAEKTILRAINSVINQSYKNWKLYIIDDHSNDNSSKLINDFKDDRIIYIRNEYNLGVAKSRNIGLDNCSEDLIAFIDSDDYWDENKLIKQIHFINSGYDVVITEYKYITTNQINSIKIEKNLIDKYQYLSKKYRVCFSSLIYNVKRVETGIRFMDVGHEDFIFINQLLNNNRKCYCIKEQLVSYYVTSNSLSSKKYKALIWHWQALNIILQKKHFKALYYFTKYIYRALKFKRLYR